MMRLRQLRRTDEKVILHVAPTPYFADRGCHMRIHGIVSALNRKGTRNIVCAYHHGRDMAGVETVRICPVPGFRKREAGPTAYKYIADVFLIALVLRVALRHKPEVIYGHLHEGALIGWLVKVLLFWRRTTLIFDVQGSLSGELEAYGYFRRRPIRRLAFHAIESLVTKLPDHFVCSSRASAEMLVSQFRVSSSRISVVRDGVDVSSGEQPMPQGAVSRERPIVIYSGALLRSKGLDVLYEMLEEMKRRGTRCRVRIVGYPEEATRKYVLAKELGDMCEIVGRVPYEKLGEHLKEAAVAIEPKPEGTGEGSGKLLNYMKAALPVVCFDTPNNRDILGEDGYYGKSVSELVDRIEDVFADPQEAAMRGSRGRYRAESWFSWDRAAEAIVWVYGRYQGALGTITPVK